MQLTQQVNTTIIIPHGSRARMSELQRDSFSSDSPWPWCAETLPWSLAEGQQRTLLDHRLMASFNSPFPRVPKWSCNKRFYTIIIWHSVPTSPDVLVSMMIIAIAVLLIYKVLMGGHDLRYPLPYPLPGFFSTTLPEPYPKSKNPTRPSLKLGGVELSRSINFWRWPIKSVHEELCFAGLEGLQTCRRHYCYCYCSLFTVKM